MLKDLGQYYRDHFEEVSDFYHRSSFKDRLEWLEQTKDKRLDTHELCKVLNAYQKKISTHEFPLRQIEKIEKEEAVVVVGGQQAGFLTGPLYTIYKAISLIQYARWAEKELGKKVVPIYWIAGEDHDLQEINHVHMLDSALDIKKIAIDTPSKNHTMASYFFTDFKEAWTKVKELLMPTEFREKWITVIEEILENSTNLTLACAKILHYLFAEYGLVIFDSSDPDIRKLEAWMFKKMIAQNEALRKSFYDTRASLMEKGFQVPVKFEENQAHLFYCVGQERFSLNYEEGKFVNEKQQLNLREEELLQNSNHLSNNVLTRPLMQEYLFPTLATVLGPAEISYWGLTKKAFETLEFQMPLLVRRQSFTLLEKQVQKNMDKFGLEIQDDFEHFYEKKQNFLSGLDEIGIAAKFNTLKYKIEHAYESITNMLEQVDPTLVSLSKQNLQKVFEQVNYLEKRSESTLQRRHEATIRQWKKIQQTVYPFQKPQERVYNILTYLNRYGTNWITQLVERPIDWHGNMQFIIL